MRGTGLSRSEGERKKRRGGGQPGRGSGGEGAQKEGEDCGSQGNGSQAKQGGGDPQWGTGATGAQRVGDPCWRRFAGEGLEGSERAPGRKTGEGNARDVGEAPHHGGEGRWEAQQRQAELEWRVIPPSGSTRTPGRRRAAARGSPAYQVSRCKLAAAPPNDPIFTPAVGDPWDLAQRVGWAWGWWGGIAHSYPLTHVGLFFI